MCVCEYVYVCLCLRLYVCLDFFVDFNHHRLLMPFSVNSRPVLYKSDNVCKNKKCDAGKKKS